jgi:hypothetical protein
MALMQKKTGHQGSESDTSIQGLDIPDNNLATRTDRAGGCVKIKIDHQIFHVLRRKKRAGETVRMAIERAIMSL